MEHMLPNVKKSFSPKQLAQFPTKRFEEMALATHSRIYTMVKGYLLRLGPMGVEHLTKFFGTPPTASHYVKRQLEPELTENPKVPSAASALPPKEKEEEHEEEEEDQLIIDLEDFSDAADGIVPTSNKKVGTTSSRTKKTTQKDAAHGAKGKSTSGGDANAAHGVQQPKVKQRKTEVPTLVLKAPVVKQEMPDAADGIHIHMSGTEGQQLQIVLYNLLELMKAQNK